MLRFVRLAAITVLVCISPAAPATPSIHVAHWWDACVAWGRLARNGHDRPREQAYLDYLSQRGLLSTKDMLAPSGDISIGMTQCGVIAALGMPDGGVNTTETARGQSAQMVYRRRGIYVYTDDARPFNGLQTVTSIQRGN